jgi:hypothetical protein
MINQLIQFDRRVIGPHTKSVGITPCFLAMMAHYDIAEGGDLVNEYYA